MSDPLLIDAKAAADLLGIGRTNFLNLDLCGRLGPRGVKLGRRKLWSRAELEAWVGADCPARGRWVAARGAG